jgi:hypothetical protein
MTDLMDRPFGELHEIYRIVYLRAEAQAKADKERQEKEKAQEEAKRKSKGLHAPMRYRPNKPTDVKPQIDSTYVPSALEAEAMEDMLEELADGSVM